MKCNWCGSYRIKNNICEYCGRKIKDEIKKEKLETINSNRWIYKKLYNTKIIWDRNIINYAENCEIVWNRNIINNHINTTVKWDRNIF